jgi:hypothetical protein
LDRSWGLYSSVTALNSFFDEVDVMKTIPISAKGFADFVLAGPSKKATIVRNILKPKSTQAQVIVLYYARAIRIIRLYHTKGNDRDYLKQEIHGLEKKLEAATTNQARAGIRNNLRAIRSYMDIYGHRKRKIVPRPRIHYYARECASLRESRFSGRGRRKTQAGQAGDYEEGRQSRACQDYAPRDVSSRQR